MSEYKPKVRLAGEALHRRAEQILGKREYDQAEYLDALERADAETRTAETVEELAERLVRERPDLTGIEAARVLARAKLGEFSQPEDPIQVAAERLARQRGGSIDSIRDYRELASLYEEAGRMVVAESGG